MCISERIRYGCGHKTPMVVRPCPLTTANPRSHTCTVTVADDFVYRPESMCPACTRELHNRWVLIQEAEHRFLHKRMICGCDVRFPNLMIRPRVITQSYNVEQNVATHTNSSPAGQFELWKGRSEANANTIDFSPVDNPLIQEALQNDNNAEPAVASGSQQTITLDYQVPTNNPTNGNSSGSATNGSASSSAIPPLYHEATTADGTRMPLTRDEAQILAWHRQILEHPETVTMADVTRWRRQTGIPNLGEEAAFTVTQERGVPAPPHMFPANLGPSVRALNANTLQWAAVNQPLPPLPRNQGSSSGPARGGPSNIIGHETSEHRTARHNTYRDNNNNNNRSGPSGNNHNFGGDGASDRPRRSTRPGQAIPVGHRAPAPTPEETYVTFTNNNVDLAGRVTEQLRREAAASAASVASSDEADAAAAAARSRSVDDRAEQERIRAYLAGVEIVRSDSAPAAVVGAGSVPAAVPAAGASVPGAVAAPAAGEASGAVPLGAGAPQGQQVYAGLPVGAGPEGSVGHMPSYEQCPLRRPTE